MLMNRRNSLLMIIDVQERLASAMDDPRQVISNSARLVGAAKAMGVPFVITEQYPKGLGQTMIDVRQEAGDEAAFFQSCIFPVPANRKLCGQYRSLAAGRLFLPAPKPIFVCFRRLWI